MNELPRPQKQRLDILMVERGLAPTRTIAQAMIMAGEVRIGTTAVTKPGMLIGTQDQLIVAQKARYVSRGGDKLASVAADLKLDFRGAVVLDVGSSTGGFTDFALQHGATHSYAVDVGTGQLAYALRQDPRISVMERTDIRDVAAEKLDPRPTVAVIDVSFISLLKILPSVAAIVTPGSPIVAMAKPQFETDKPTADRYHGVIKDETVRQRILRQFEQGIAEHFTTSAWADSSVHGAQGNRERFYLLVAKR